MFQDRYVQVDQVVPTHKIYGFGERLSNFARGQGAWTMWNHDKEHDIDLGTGGKQLAGTHPFCLIKADDYTEEFVGIFFRSSNAQAPIISYNLTTHKTILRYVTVGGNLDINYFFGGTAKEVIANYQKFIGLPQLPPFWALGFHASSNNWTSLDQVKTTVSKYQSEKYPLETIWLDGNYMENPATFTADTGGNFTGLRTYAEELK